MRTSILSRDDPSAALGMKTKTSFLFGITAGRWFRLLWHNRLGIAPRYLHRAVFLTLMSLVNSYYHHKEQRRHAADIATVELNEPPLFIIGHWRSGTTLLHNFLNEDPRFATPNTYQVIFPHTFLVTEETYSRRLARLIPPKRAQDNMPQSWKVPQEDEIAMNMCTLYSPALSWSFPQREAHYDRYFTFREAPAEAAREWQQAFLHFARKLTCRYRRPIVFKSPLHTCRIRLLLELFPEARFVHIIRDPYRVFQSTVHLFDALQHNLLLLQRMNDIPHSERVLRLYHQIHDAYFDEVGLIPDGRFHLMRFEDLERDPVGEVRRMYDALHIPDFHRFEPRLKTYLGSLTGYRKNVYPPLDEKLREEIADRWRRNFTKWGYPI